MLARLIDFSLRQRALVLLAALALALAGAWALPVDGRVARPCVLHRVVRHWRDAQSGADRFCLDLSGLSQPLFGHSRRRCAPTSRRAIRIDTASGLRASPARWWCPRAPATASCVSCRASCSTISCRAKRSARWSTAGAEARAFGPAQARACSAASMAAMSASFCSHTPFIHCWKRARKARSAW